MSKDYYIITWNCGIGEEKYKVIKCGYWEEAIKHAEIEYKRDAKRNMIYSAKKATFEGLEDIGIDPSEYGIEFNVNKNN